MINIISLDVGDKRVGVALGTLDPETLKPRSSSPFAIFKRQSNEAEKKIISLIEEKAVRKLVVGLPLNEDGTVNEQCLKIERFCHRIQRRCNVKIVFVDEYASTAEAEERIVELKRMSIIGSKSKIEIDAVSASIILENYFSNGLEVVLEEGDKN